MKENGKKIVSITSLIVVSLLLVGLTIASFAPIMSISMDHMSQDFTNGSFTGDKNIGKVNLDFMTLPKIIKDWKYIIYVSNVQQKEQYIKDIIENPSYDEDKIARETKELEEKYLSIGESDREILTEKLQNEEFIETLAVFDIFSKTLFNFSNLVGDSSESAVIDANSHGMLYIILFTLISLGFMFVLVLVMPIVLVISVLVLIIKVIKNAKKLHDVSLYKIVPKMPMGFFLISGVIAYFPINALYRAFNFEIGYIIPCILVAIIAIIFIANDIIMSKKKTAAWIRSGVLTVSIIGVLLVAFSFNNSTHLFSHFDNIESVAQNCVEEAYEEEYKKLIEIEKPQNQDDINLIQSRARSYARGIAQQAAKKEVHIVGITTLVSTFFVIVMLCSVISLCVDNGSIVKTKNNQTKKAGGVNSASPVLAGLVVLSLVVPFVLVSASNVEERDNAFNSDGCGSMILWDEYTMEDSNYFIDEEELAAFEKEYEDYIEELDESIADADDEEKEKLELLKAQAKDGHTSLMKRIDRVKCGRKSAAITALIGSVIYLIAQIFGKVVYKKGEENFLDKKQEVSTSETTA
ncbi:MAG: hypothetical protein E7592_01885 [Ruminococcaceae bacterium]|nr:hypothetical protein [Oscillospiraceae bacterium]